MLASTSTQARENTKLGVASLRSNARMRNVTTGQDSQSVTVKHTNPTLHRFHTRGKAVRTNIRINLSRNEPQHENPDRKHGARGPETLKPGRNLNEIDGSHECTKMSNQTERPVPIKSNPPNATHTAQHRTEDLTTSNKAERSTMQAQAAQSKANWPEQPRWLTERSDQPQAATEQLDMEQAF